MLKFANSGLQRIEAGRWTLRVCYHVIARTWRAEKAPGAATVPALREKDIEPAVALPKANAQHARRKETISFGSRASEVDSRRLKLSRIIKELSPNRHRTIRTPSRGVARLSS